MMVENLSIVKSNLRSIFIVISDFRLYNTSSTRVLIFTSRDTRRDCVMPQIREFDSVSFEQTLEDTVF
jgi:hypothetical protein